MLDYIGWFDGLSAMGVIISGCFFGFLCIYKSKKLNAKLLTYAGLTIFFIGLIYLGPFTDFMSILLTGNNLTYELYVFLAYMWIGPGMLLAMYVGAELMEIEKTMYIIIIYSILAIIFELFLFLDTMNSFTFALEKPGENLIDASFILGSPMFVLMAVFLVSVFFFNGIGFLYKNIQSTGILRKRFLFLSIGFIVFVIFGTFDSLVAPGITLFLVRTCIMVSTWLMYIGLKT
ncbi:MAG: hypothetical protein ACTSRI_13190 [Promethearchaeota archaeon]